jgi:hypothetical protein
MNINGVACGCSTIGNTDSGYRSPSLGRMNDTRALQQPEANRNPCLRQDERLMGLFAESLLGIALSIRTSSNQSPHQRF